MDREQLKENRIHGDEMFPFGIYSVCSKEGDRVLDCHWHDEWEFLIVTEGKAVFQIGTLYYEVYQGQAVFINSGEIHAGYPLHNSTCSFSAVVFNPGVLCSQTFDTVQSKFIDPLLRKQYIPPVHIKPLHKWEKEVLMHLRNIINLGNLKPRAYELSIKAQLYLIFSSIISNNDLSLPEKPYSTQPYTSERLKKILKYIHSNYNKKLNIKELARLLNMSEGYFCRFFKQAVRKTPIEYINYYRVNKAAELLESSRKKIIEIAMDAGFDNCSYFISTFKHYMKCTPSEYRRQN